MSPGTAKWLRCGAAIVAALMLIPVLAALWWLSRPGLSPEQPTAAPVTGQGLSLSWFGVSAILLDDGEHAVMVDPFFTRPEGVLPLLANRRIAPDEARVRAALEQAGIDRLDAVLVSHSHFDHAMDAGLVARLTGARLIGSESTANIGRGAGLPESRLHVVRAGEALQAGVWDIRFHRSRHAGATGGRPLGDIESPLSPPARYSQWRQGGTWSIEVRHPVGTLLHHGSAGFEPGALDEVRADAVVLGVALIEDLPTYLEAVVDRVGARHVYAVHWDDFTRPLDAPLRPLPLGVDLDAFFADIERLSPQVRARLLPLAEPVAMCGEMACVE